MPDGIVVELLIVLAFLVIIVVAVVVARRTRGPEEPSVTESLPTGDTPVMVDERETPVTEIEERPEVTGEVEAKPDLRARLARSRRFLADRLAAVLQGGVDEDTWDDVEATLIQADLGVSVASRITTDLRARSSGRAEADEVRARLADELNQVFDATAERALTFGSTRPTVWLVMGVNGTGKTTTIGKLAHDLRQRGRSVALAAADTFRAAADEQLSIWADRAGAQLIKHQQGADPGAVAFDAVQFSRARNIDALIVDTAGRLHTKTPLMDELSKVRRVIEKETPVDEALLVIDATSGQNGLVQAREFAEAAGVTGIVLTKLDGTAKGGIALTIESELGIPIKLIGIGEGIDDLEPFEPKAFVDALLS